MFPVQALGYVNSSKLILGLPETAGVHFLLLPHDSIFYAITQFRNGGPQGNTLCRKQRLLRVHQRELVLLDGSVKVGNIFSQLAWNKMVLADGRKCSYKWSTTNRPKRFGWTSYKGRGGCCGVCTVAFLNGVYEPTDSDIDIGNDNEIFSSHLREKAYISTN